MFISLFFLAADISQRFLKPGGTEQDLKNASMKLFFRDLTREGKRMIVENYNDGEKSGITGNANEIIGIRYVNFQHGNFFIDALPHSTKTIEIRQCLQSFQIHTRMFPRSLISINIRLNEITGRPDLTVLPSKLEALDLSYNSLNGPVSLVRLPASLKYIALDMNRIQQKTLWYSDLPENLANVRLKETFGLHAPAERNRFDRVKALDQAYAVGTMRKGIFLGIDRNDVM